MYPAISLHIGLNSVDKHHYQGWSGELVACEYDARDMQQLCEGVGFPNTNLVLTKEATISNVSEAIKDAATHLEPGGLFVLTYSGHGGQVPDRNNDEEDSQDETWVLYDRMLIDDELYTLFSFFPKETRILVLSDSCHSGTVTRLFSPTTIRHRAMPRPINSVVYTANQQEYETAQNNVKSLQLLELPSIILISGCQDSQLSLDGDKNGLFTENLKKVWRAGKFKGGHKHFRNRIAYQIALGRGMQTPYYSLVGNPNPRFEKQRPFTITP